jgi:hypothetical protein
MTKRKLLIKELLLIVDKINFDNLNEAEFLVVFPDGTEAWVKVSIGKKVYELKLVDPS